MTYRVSEELNMREINSCFEEMKIFKKLKEKKR